MTDAPRRTSGVTTAGRDMTAALPASRRRNGHMTDAPPEHLGGHRGQDLRQPRRVRRLPPASGKARRESRPAGPATNHGKDFSAPPPRPPLAADGSSLAPAIIIVMILGGLNTVTTGP